MSATIEALRPARGTKAPLVSVVVPAFDEERWIIDCLAAVARQDHPHASIEVIVVIDGASEDSTEQLAEEFLDQSDFARTEVVRNSCKGTPANLNTGLALVRGAVLTRVDARSNIPADYVRRCAEILNDRPEVAVVGGSQVAVGRDDALGKGIARALNNRWGMGLSKYRRGARSGPADTVYLGAYRTADLRAVDGWRLDLATNQDFDLNRRMASLGVVWFERSLRVAYVPRPDLRSLHRQYVRFGVAKVRYWLATGDRPQPRQVVLLGGVPAAAALTAVGLIVAPVNRRVVIGAVAAAAVLVETVGSRHPSGGPAVHTWSAIALGAVGLGWLRGAWRELLRLVGSKTRRALHR